MFLWKDIWPGTLTLFLVPQMWPDLMNISIIFWFYPDPIVNGTTKIRDQTLLPGYQCSHICGQLHRPHPAVQTHMNEVRHRATSCCFFPTLLIILNAMLCSTAPNPRHASGFQYPLLTRTPNILADPIGRMKRKENKTYNHFCFLLQLTCELWCKGRDGFPCHSISGDLCHHIRWWQPACNRPVISQTWSQTLSMVGKISVVLFFNSESYQSATGIILKNQPIFALQTYQINAR